MGMTLDALTQREIHEMIDKLGLDGLGGASVRKLKVVGKLTALVEAAKEVNVPMYLPERTQDDVYRLRNAWQIFHDLANPATILELCALLEEAEEALRLEVEVNCNNPDSLVDALAAIKQWKESKE